MKYAKATITVKYLGPTDTKPARMKATCQAGSKIIPYPNHVEQDSAYIEAAFALIDDKGLAWGPNWTMGRLDNDSVIFTPITCTNVVEL